MDNYIPFLKFKGSEISAIKALEKKHKGNEFVPFFDFPRKKPKKSRRLDAPLPSTKDELFAKDIIRLKRKFELNLSFLKKFYLDNFDVEDTISYKGQYTYRSIIQTFGPLGMIPVIGLDRHNDHLPSILDGIRSGNLKADQIAIRLTVDDFESYKFSQKELLNLLDAVFLEFENIEIIFDCRICHSNSGHNLATMITDFINELQKEIYVISKFIVSGSSIPASIKDLIEPRSEKDISREELVVFQKMLLSTTQDQTSKLYFGDYTCVSPDYSDVELFDEDMDNVTTAKIIYPYKNNIIVIRGGRFKSDRKQIKDLATKLVNKSHIYRGDIYSNGDKYIHNQSNGIGSAATAASIVPHLINLHLTYMLNK
ncbi:MULTISPECIES: beta family protein [Pantoea]|uniref:beta family protein n=1 Tax=Pantoea TaxID=53335 RepID=UPI00257BD0CB|nr:hypothetical protein [Pantoea sp. UBA5960]